MASVKREEAIFADLPLNQILFGDCLDILPKLPSHSIDLIFADPPYNLQLQKELWRPNQTPVVGVDDEWDRFANFEDYDDFTTRWLSECRRVLKTTGTLWVIGSYHNIYRVGKIMMDLGFWILNDVIWHKTNPMPNFRGARFQNATEILLWAKRSREARGYTFQYQAMKNLNEGKQMQNVWHLPLCTGAERMKIDGKKAHSTQKPEALLYRVILASSKPGDVVLDPFLGTGTTAVVAKRLGRHFIGIERDPRYIGLAQERLKNTPFCGVDERELLITPSKRAAPRVAFGQLVEAGYLQVGTVLYSRDRRIVAYVKADSLLRWDSKEGSIHQIAALAEGKPACNGWEYWYYEDEDGQLISIDVLRARYRAENGLE